MAIDLIFSFDTTGSMYPCIAEVRRKLADTVQQLFKDIPDLRIGLIAHGDFIDKRLGGYVTNHLDLTDSLGKLVGFVSTVGPTFGGDGPECYEVVLHEARQHEWRTHAEKILVMIGDAIPHEKGKRTANGYYTDYDWREEARKLRKSGVTIHAVQCLKCSKSYWWPQLAEIGCGTYLTLAQFSHINELIGAVAHHANDTLDNYADGLGDLVLNRGVAEILRQLRGESAKETFHRSGLIPVPASRFQMLHVDENTPIKQFVLSTGAKFRTGRGFYQFTKRETIQENKEVILVDKETGDMFSGYEARELLGLPFGTRGRLSPHEVSERGYDVFIQSTSYNRKLIGGTRFLYEAELD